MIDFADFKQFAGLGDLTISINKEKFVAEALDNEVYREFNYLRRKKGDDFALSYLKKNTELIPFFKWQEQQERLKTESATDQEFDDFLNSIHRISETKAVIRMYSN